MEVQALKSDSLIEVCHVDDLPVGEFKTFDYNYDGYAYQGVVINYNSELYAYLNICPHAGIPLDASDSGLFNADGSYLICRKHWALFEPHTGKCVSGPCPIAPLLKFDVIIQEGTIFVSPKL
jgi:nitrite reductase/ring-hydroxylating ferredoxin subunit